jgi:hypothetical protein
LAYYPDARHIAEAALRTLGVRHREGVAA